MVIRTCNHRSAHSDPFIHPSIIHPAVPRTVYIPTTQNPSKTKKKKKKKKVGSTNSIGQHLKVTRIRAKKKLELDPNNKQGST